MRIPSAIGAACLALALTACGEPEEKTYEADATDESGSELIVSEADEQAVPVDTPDIAMTPVPEGGAPAEGAVEEEPAQ